MMPLPDGTDDDPGDPFVIQEYGNKLPVNLDSDPLNPSKWEEWYDAIGMSCF